MIVACEFRWEMGHRLAAHGGACRNLHGHSYRMRVTVQGTVREDGMVLDFDELKRHVQPLVDAWDHAMLCDRRDRDLLEFLRAHDMKHTVIPFAATAENIVDHMVREIGTRLAHIPTLTALTVRVYETTTAFAEETIPLGTDGGA